MEPYPVYYEKEGELVAEFKFTVLIMPNNTMKITGLPVDLDSYQTDNTITDEAVKGLLQMSLVTKNKKKKTKSKTAKKTSEEGETAAPAAPTA